MFALSKRQPSHRIDEAGIEKPSPLGDKIKDEMNTSILRILYIVILASILLPAKDTATQPTLSASTYYELLIEDASTIILNDLAGRVIEVVNAELVRSQVDDIEVTTEGKNVIFTFPKGTQNTFTLTMRQARYTSPFSLRLTGYSTSVDQPTPRPFEAIIFTDAQVTSDGSAFMTIDFSSDLAKTQILIDLDGDNAIDEIRLPDRVLDREQLEDDIAPVTQAHTTVPLAVALLSGTVTIRAQAVDNDSGVMKTQYSLDGGASWQTYTDPFSVVPDEVPILYIQSIDYAGNVETPFELDLTSSGALPQTMAIVIGVGLALLLTTILSILYLPILKRKRSSKAAQPELVIDQDDPQQGEMK